MSFQTGLSGLNASGKSLDVIGHNIANANTVGMKASRTEFSDVVASAIGPSGGGGAGGSGIGVAISAVSQQFSQGNISLTGNTLDLAVNGGGFFMLEKKDGTFAYTRDGQFKLDANGGIITNSGAKLRGYPTDVLGNPTSTQAVPLTLPTGAPIPAQATANITAELNLDARAQTAISTVPPTPIATYGTALTAYDSQGVGIPVSLYFVKTGADTWDVFDSNTVAAGTTALTTNAATTATSVANAAWNAIPANTAGGDLKPTLTSAGAGAYAGPALSLVASGASFSMTFDTTGKLTSPLTSPTINLTSPNPNIGTFAATLDVSNVSQYGTSFAVSSLDQDGYTAGNLTGISINDKGVITTRYSNGESQAKGMVALADFRNVQGLQPDGDGWVETVTSGMAISGQPGNGNMGGIRSGALEDSNVDLTAELVNMMTAQRNYQANAQTIKTQDQVMSTLVNLR
ncbi:flagellar hook protein FlgE [Curvibacter sp. APW13]|uniref:flagellar hook protein FlgE n=1 Tax=Curvibacter sp. APW13 TaxID=3077236 RepID=UPI0028E01FEF|nr:flagellar hook protein FlgE [Curvibacter sp. APW13]MDT8993042.1 flagellar hook protein FlgE [Curvibacter sp. APW13]